MERLRPTFADFGTVLIKVRMDRETTIRGSRLPQNAGTPFYQAPEVQCDSLPAQPSSDVWTLCLAFVEWFTGRRAWKEKLTVMQIVRLKDRKQMPERLDVVDEEVRDILKDGLNYDRHQRPTALQLKQRLDGV